MTQISLQVPNDQGVTQIDLTQGERLYVLGPNGSGKSSLIHHFVTQQQQISRRISAHRQTWFTSDSLDMSAQAKRQSERNIQARDSQPESRWKDDLAPQRPNIAVYDLIDAENVRAREIAALVDAQELAQAVDKSKALAPVAAINELMQLSGIPIVLSVVENERVLARRDNSEPYSIAELSDGERNALLLAASVLTAPDGSLILIDEPERHLHRSIATPLLQSLFARRSNCFFVVATHDVVLASDDQDAKVLLLRECTYSGKRANSWLVDLLTADSTIPDEIRQDILGSRRKLLFVEGTDESLDKSLYALLYPDATVLPKGNCRQVEQAVHAIRSTESVHWARPFGIVDGDGRDNDTIRALRDAGIIATEWYSIESIFYHPEVLLGIATRIAALDGSNAENRAGAAKEAAIAGASEARDHLCERLVKQKARELVFEHLPGKELPNSIEVLVDVEQLRAAESRRF
ncbi:MAG: AAA family ATPase, partial [Pseudomonadota bacterium]